jgi:hypothetical protein
MSRCRADHKGIVGASGDAHDGRLQAVDMQAQAPRRRVGVVLVGACAQSQHSASQRAGRILLTT